MAAVIAAQKADLLLGRDARSGTGKSCNNEGDEYLHDVRLLLLLCYSSSGTIGALMRVGDEDDGLRRAKSTLVHERWIERWSMVGVVVGIPVGGGR